MVTVLNLSRNQLRILTGLLIGCYHLKGHLFRLGMVKVPSVIDARKQLKRSHTALYDLRLWAH